MISESPGTNIAAEDFASVAAIYSELNTEIQALGEPRLEKLAVHIKMPPADSAAFRFYGGVSWMYVAVFESGAISLRFLIDRAQALGIDPQFEMADFRAAIHALRTLFQHGLDATERKDAATYSFASRWMATACGSDERPNEYFWPSEQADWEKLALRFRGDAESFLLKCLEVVRHIQRDESREATVQEWASRCSRSLPGYVFDDLITKAVQQLGLPFLDPVRVRNTHLQKWNERLRLLDETADLVGAARGLIDDTLLREWEHYCPLNGGDIIEHFHLPPGPKVGELVQLARQLWKAAPSSREQLLLQLKEKL